MHLNHVNSPIGTLLLEQISTPDQPPSPAPEVVCTLVADPEEAGQDTYTTWWVSGKKQNRDRNRHSREI